MVNGDFFGFCTTLKPLQLKAMGELSEVLHLTEGMTVYSPGDVGESLYIINRGVVEIGHGNGTNTSAETYLSRGDIFGDVEALIESPRKQLVRVREPASLQCFHRKNFAELIKRVPSFFQYLSERLAFRLSQTKDLTQELKPTKRKDENLELSGNLSNFDLVTLYQTIINSGQTGELKILNDKSETIAALFFEKGKPRCSQFEHLSGEEAFSQLFLSDSLAGSFSFSATERALADWVESERIARNPEEMLIHALQGRDELNQLKRRLCQSARLRRKKPVFSWPSSAWEDLKPVAQQIFDFVSHGPATLSSLFSHCTFSELKIYEAVDELVESENVDLLPPVPNK
jgi:CRP-like cAMP-binding protein